MTVLNISAREFDALARIAWYEALRGYNTEKGLQPGINVVVSILNKRIAGMHPQLSQANPDYRRKDIIGLINQPRRYEPVWRYGGGNVFNLELDPSERRIAEAAVREAIINLHQHWHPGTLFQQTSVTDARGTSFVRAGESVLRDGVGHEFSRSYRSGARTVTPPYRIGEQTLAMLGVGPQHAHLAMTPSHYTRRPPQMISYDQVTQRHAMLTAQQRATPFQAPPQQTAQWTPPRPLPFVLPRPAGT